MITPQTMLTEAELDELYALLAGDRMEAPHLYRGVSLDQVKALCAAAGAHRNDNKERGEK